VDQARKIRLPFSRLVASYFPPVKLLPRQESRVGEAEERERSVHRLGGAAIHAPGCWLYGSTAALLRKRPGPFAGRPPPEAHSPGHNPEKVCSRRHRGLPKPRAAASPSRAHAALVEIQPVIRDPAFRRTFERHTPQEFEQSGLERNAIRFPFQLMGRK